MPNPISASTTKPNKCPDHGVISVSDRGRLGNLMSQYATLYAYSKLLDRQPVISQHMSNTLLKVFPSASIPSSSICKLQGLFVNKNKLEPVCCKKRPKIVPDKLLVLRVQETSEGPEGFQTDSKVILSYSHDHLRSVWYH